MLRKMFSSIIMAALLIALHGTASANSAPIRIYLDADRSGTPQSTISIERGILTALSEVNNMLAGRQVELVRLNHRGNAARSKLHLEMFTKDSNALAVFCGLHSPPVLSAMDYINANEILLLNPWAAAAPLTRKGGENNWIFRCSLDDAKAADVITRFALSKGVMKPSLLLEQTGWGKSNHKTFTKALQGSASGAPPVHWFHWGIRDSAARPILRTLLEASPDAVFLVANAPEAKTVLRALSGLSDTPPPVFSHWGITGGDFPEHVPHSIREKVSLYFIQTNFSFLSPSLSPFAKKVFSKAQRLFPELASYESLTAPAGFIHAYDLTRLLIAAVAQAGVNEDMRQTRRNVKHALEHLQKPVQGLLKTYNRPFSPLSVDPQEGHEALTIDDLAMARYGAKNEIRLLPSGGR